MPPRQFLLAASRPLLMLLLLLLLGNAGTRAQRSHARQGGLNPREAPTLRLPAQGTIVGREVFLSRTQRVIQYLGIPYAQPPVKELRFAPPVTEPLPTWSGLRNASAFGPSCPQVTSRRKLHERLYLRLLPPDLPDPGLSEDCLFLNVYMPDNKEEWLESLSVTTDGDIIPKIAVPLYSAELLAKKREMKRKGKEIKAVQNKIRSSENEKIIEEKSMFKIYGQSSRLNDRKSTGKIFNVESQSEDEAIIESGPYSQKEMEKLHACSVQNFQKSILPCCRLRNLTLLHSYLSRKLAQKILSSDNEVLRGINGKMNQLLFDIRNRPPEGWPVMVWFHGGDFNSGTPAIWDASVFVTKQKVLVVTVAYRLNILGFFTTTDAESPGNYGLLDQIAALNWVKEYIELFDGSASNIIIYGHSAGAISVGLHMMSPLSRGKFAKAIAMSGDAINSVRTPQDELPIVDQVADRFGCYRTTSDLMECLRNVDIEILIRETANIETWGPIVDADINNSTEGPFLPRHPRDVEAEGFYAVPLITGFTNNEQALAFIEAIGSENVDGRLPVSQFEAMIREESVAAVLLPSENSTCELRPELVSEAVLFFYKPHPPTRDQKVLRDRYLDLQTEKNYAAGLTQLAAKVSSHPSKVQAFVYRFDYRARTQAVTRDVPEWAGVPHMFELPFVWGLPYALTPLVQWNAADKKMADVMMSMFSIFARTANPSINTIKWEPYYEKNPGILIVERTIDMSDTGAVDYKALAFWSEYYPLVLEAATNNCCNVTSSAVSTIVCATRSLDAWRTTSAALTLSIIALRKFFV